MSTKGVPSKINSANAERQGRKSFWTADREAFLRSKAEAGGSAGTIADALGCTRNAVIGKAHRLGIQLHGKGIYNAKRAADAMKRRADRLRARIAAMQQRLASMENAPRDNRVSRETSVST